MNYEILYKNTLKVINKIYEESKYNKNVDFFRIPDIINSVNDNQIESKKWLVNTLFNLPNFNKFIKETELKNKLIYIAGGWYGLTGLLLREKINNNIIIHSCDIDPLTKIYGSRLTKGYNIHFRVDEAFDYFLDYCKFYNLIINTSCEHMEYNDVKLMCSLKRRDAIICLQSNNYFEVDSHIGCHNSLSDFVNSLNLKKIYYQGEKKLENCDRYMVIGK